MDIATSMTVVRCPYCISDDEFRPMEALSGGRFACVKCGHLAFPSDKRFECACRKCFELRTIGARGCG